MDDGAEEIKWLRRRLPLVPTAAQRADPRKLEDRLLAIGGLVKKGVGPFRKTTSFSRFCCRVARNLIVKCANFVLCTGVLGQMRNLARDSIVRTGSVELHYQAVGSGETIVFIHGLGANLAFWFLNVVRVLAADYQVITYDLRGHGKSSMPAHGYRLDNMAMDLCAILDHLGITRCHVVGHSFGARIGLLYSMERPQTVISLTVADTQLSALQPRLRLREWSFWDEWKKQLTNLGITPPDDNEYLTYRLLAWLNQHSLDATVGGLSRRRNRRPSLKSRNMGNRGALLWERLLETTTAATEFEDDGIIQVNGLRRITAPTLAVYGEHSHCLPTGVRLTQLIPSCDLRVVPKAGHFHPATRPKIFLHLIESFLHSHREI